MHSTSGAPRDDRQDDLFRPPSVFVAHGNTGSLPTCTDYSIASEFFTDDF
jgi:hypothetical protein